MNIADKNHGKNIALIVAAGSGQRSGQNIPKQYALIDDKAMVAHSAKAFARHPHIDAIYIVIGEGQEQQAKEALQDIIIDGYIIGGATRQESVYNGLESLSHIKSIKNVFIHDAARPHLSHNVIDRLLYALTLHKAAIPSLPLPDTIAHINNDMMHAPADREKFMRIQTPQAFHFQSIWSAHQKAINLTNQNYSDDAQIIYANGHKVAMVAGDADLRKYTFQEDFMTQKQKPMFRIGNGYDVHRFGEGESLWLGGIKIEYHMGLIGHSDADIVLHALTDALLGALALGDIGDHFPPSDPKWRNAKSDIFIKYACNLASKAGYKISNTDITIICEKPKIGPHRKAIRTSLATILGISVEQISLKATTTEMLGFTGRGEGMAVQAQILIEKTYD